MDITLDPIVVFILKLNTPDKHKGLVQLNPYLSKLRQQPHFAKHKLLKPKKKTTTKYGKVKVRKTFIIHEHSGFHDCVHNECVIYCYSSLKCFTIK